MHDQICMWKFQQMCCFEDGFQQIHHKFVLTFEELGFSYTKKRKIQKHLLPLNPNKQKRISPSLKGVFIDFVSSSRPSFPSPNVGWQYQKPPTCRWTWELCYCTTELRHILGQPGRLGIIFQPSHGVSGAMSC